MSSGTRRPGSGSATAPAWLLGPQLVLGTLFLCLYCCSGKSQGVSLLKRLGCRVVLAPGPRLRYHPPGLPWIPGTLLTSLGSPGGPCRRGRSYRGSFAARVDPEGIFSSKRLGRRGSCSRRHQAGARRSPGHREPRLQLRAAQPLQSTGAHAPGLSAGSFSVSAAPPVQGSCIKGQAAPNQFCRDGPAPTAILVLGLRRVNGARLHHRSPHQDPNGTGRSRGWLARHHWVAKSW
ncbi:hypothetical protein NDU88_007737 [Pleurodeles waltl]|uniref:Uncharacterized protein n=1 Tax=Pleurodeles waltl TaxID=8319 RepID=A0AAV7N2Y6_PLEWA|nr:hypothetical protein NDU88_007737 [Pleurodeles waltl]